MSAQNNGGPAFPAPDAGEADYGTRGDYRGLTMRDYFAAKAMQAAMGSCDLLQGQPEDFAGIAYTMADAMLKARTA